MSSDTEMPKLDGREWRGRSIDIYTPHGTPVVFHGACLAQIKWGGNTDPNDKLELGKTYVVDFTEVHTWHTKVGLVGIPGKFPAEAFHYPEDAGWAL